MDDGSVTIIGLGKLGFTKAVLHANYKKATYGYDIDLNLLRQLSSGINPYKEKDLEEKFELAKPFLKLGLSLSECVINSSVVYVVVPTPSLPDGNFSNAFVLKVLTEVAEILKISHRMLTIVICSTVMPGSCEKILIPLIEKISGKINGVGFNLVYSPEFIALGNVVFNMQNPDMLLIGSETNTGADLVEKFASRIVLNKPIVNKISLVDAEISKIAVNSFITMKISFANFISEIADKMPGANSHTITKVIGSDSRIGSKYLKPGTSYGGPCFPRDNKAFSTFSNSIGIEPSLPMATDRINDRQVSRVLEILSTYSNSSEDIGIIGLSYKVSTPVVEESYSLHLVESLTSIGYRVFAFDPLAEPDYFQYKNFFFTKNMEEVIRNSKCIVLALPYDLAGSVDFKTYKDKIVIDFWNTVSSLDIGDNILIRMGTKSA
jgi:UDPglucose 6-dehydrogenase